MTIANKTNGTEIKGTYRRFEFGPAYIIRDVRHTHAGAAEVDIEMLESGEKVTLPLDQVLSCPIAE